jgi:ribosomal-protein-alanine N-acetyltransferase
LNFAGRSVTNRAMLKIGLVRPEELGLLMEIELETFTSPWTPEMFEEEMGSPLSQTLVARDAAGGLAGFIIFWVLIDEMHILNLAVRKRNRRKGVGLALVKEALRLAHARGARSATLEVREKNEPALKLYEGLGFERAGLRRGYYSSPRDNAVIMWLYDISRVIQKSP